MTGQEMKEAIEQEDHSTDILHPESLNIYVLIDGYYKEVESIKWSVDGEGEFLLLEIEK